MKRANPEQSQQYINIAYINDVIYPFIKDGVQKRVWELAVRLAHREHEIHLFGMKHWDGQDITIRNGIYLNGTCQPQRLYIHGRRSTKGQLCFL